MHFAYPCQLVRSSYVSIRRPGLPVSSLHSDRDIAVRKCTRIMHHALQRYMRQPGLFELVLFRLLEARIAPM